MSPRYPLTSRLWLFPWCYAFFALKEKFSKDMTDVQKLSMAYIAQCLVSAVTVLCGICIYETHLLS